MTLTVHDTAHPGTGLPSASKAVSRELGTREFDGVKAEVLSFEKIEAWAATQPIDTHQQQLIDGPGQVAKAGFFASRRIVFTELAQVFGCHEPLHGQGVDSWRGARPRQAR